jgi:cytoskeleton protein RodZ
MTDNTSASNDRKEQEIDNNERYQRIGAELRRRREALSLEQADVAGQLHLPGMVVNDIETGQVEKLSSIYRRGYIRNYARLLGLDPDELLAEAGEDLPPELQEVLPVSRPEWRLERYLKISTYAIVTVAIVVPLVYAFLAGGSRMLERDPGAAEQAAVSTSATDTDSATPNPPRADASDAADAPEGARHVSASTLPLNPVRPARETVERPVPAPVNDTGASGEVAGRETGPPVSALSLTLVEDSWIEIHDAQGTRLEYDLLRGGQTRSYEGQAPFRLLVGRSNAVELTVNGLQVTWDGHDSGDVAEISIDAGGDVQR